jgi:hypothetical protein
MNILKHGICAFALAFAVAAPAGAATISFAQNNAPQTGALSFTNGSETVSVVGSEVSTGSTALIASYADAGLGVCSSSYRARSPGGCNDRALVVGLGDSFMIDGYTGIFGATEAIYLDLGLDTIDLTSVTFNYVNDGDTFYIGSNEVAWDAYTIAAGASQQTFTFTTPIRGSLFGIAAIGSNDSFTVLSMGYNIVNPGPVLPTVPLPATGLLLIGALVGVGALRRRRSSNSGFAAVPA